MVCVAVRVCGSLGASPAGGGGTASTSGDGSFAAEFDITSSAMASFAIFVTDRMGSGSPALPAAGLAGPLSATAGGGAGVLAATSEFNVTVAGIAAGAAGSARGAI